jgi:hypothetical protein
MPAGLRWLGLAVLCVLISGHACAQTHTKPGAMPTPVSWASLKPQKSRALALDPASAAGVPTEDITVLARRKDDWHLDKLGAAPMYEAANSAVAGPAYVPYAAWDSDQEMRLMSSVKEALGICHWPLSCPTSR